MSKKSIQSYSAILPRQLCKEEFAEVSSDVRHLYLAAYSSSNAALSGRTGIFGINRWELSTSTGISQNEIFNLMGRTPEEIKLYLQRPNLDEADLEHYQGFCNQRLSKVIKYDPVNHIIFIKDMFRNYDAVNYFSRPLDVVRAIQKDYGATKDKCPQWWVELFRDNALIFERLYAKLSANDSNFATLKKEFEKFFKIGGIEPSTSPKGVDANKLLNLENEMLQK